MADFGQFRGFSDKLFEGQLPKELGVIGRQRAAQDPDYKQVLEYAISQGYTLPSFEQQLLQEQLIVDLKDAGVWSKLDTFSVFATDGDINFALIDWVRLTDYTAINSPTFTTNKGFNSDGTSSYIETNYNLLIDSVNYQQNDAGVFTFLTEYSSSANRGLYTALNTTNYLSTRNDVNRFWTNGGSYLTLQFFSNSNEQIFFSNRVSSTEINGRVTSFAAESTNEGSLSTNATAMIDDDLALLLRRQSSLYYLNSECIMGMFALGSQLNTSEMEDVENIWYNNYFLNL